MRTLLSVLAAAALVSGCGQSRDPIAQSATTTEPAALWDSCSLSDDVIAHAKLLPETKRDNDLFEGWRMCSWRGLGQWYSVGVYSNQHDLDSHFANPLKSDFREVTVGGRQGWTYRQAGVTHEQECALVLPTAFGAVDFRATKYSTREHPEADMCEVLLTHVELILPAIPI